MIRATFWTGRPTRFSGGLLSEDLLHVSLNRQCIVLRNPMTQVSHPSWPIPTHSRFWLLMLLCALITPSAGTAEPPAGPMMIQNNSVALQRAITERSPRWRLQSLELPSRPQGVGVDFQEVQVFATKSALITEKNGKFIRRPREPIRVFVGKPADNEFGDDVVILVARGNGELQGRWHGRGVGPPPRAGWGRPAGSPALARACPAAWRRGPTPAHTGPLVPCPGQGPRPIGATDW